MKASLKDKLDRKMQEWVDECCNDEDWPNILIHDTIEEDMADAAMDLFDTIVINQEWLHQQGYWKD